MAKHSEDEETCYFCGVQLEVSMVVVRKVAGWQMGIAKNVGEWIRLGIRVLLSFYYTNIQNFQNFGIYLQHHS